VSEPVKEKTKQQTNNEARYPQEWVHEEVCRIFAHATEGSDAES
jgi:hypothetical protein